MLPHAVQHAACARVAAWLGAGVGQVPPHEEQAAAIALHALHGRLERGEEPGVAAVWHPLDVAHNLVALGAHHHLVLGLQFQGGDCDS